MQISYSQINTYQFCPHKYQLQYRDKIPVPPAGNLLLGASVHTALKFLHQPDRLARPELEEVLNEYSRAWPEASHLPEAERAQFFAAGLDMLRRHYEREGREDAGRRTARVEHPFYLPLNGEHTLAGRIDRVNVLADGSIEVLDYKTGRSLPTQNEIDNDRQLAIYRLAAEKQLFPGKPVTSTLHYLHHEQSFTAHPEPDLAERVEAEIHWVIEKISAEEFPPRVTSYCERCDYRNYCGMFKPITADETAQADIEALIAELAQVSQTLTEINAEIKRQQARKGKLEAEILDWLNEAGTGFYQAGEVQVFSDIIRRVSFPAEEVRKLLEPLGGWDKIGSKLTVSKTALEALFKSMKLPPALQYQIMGLGVATEKPALKLKRAGIEEKAEDEV